jgi:wyosine [tRNA(Phe)-imidazoG37] synthetase (radical SAM superfamily)
MSAIPLQTGITYGPILSRRLGRSLGINLLGMQRKVCSFDCIYCQYGSAQVVESPRVGHVLPAVEDVLNAVEKAIRKPRTIEYLTFSGNGEPTLHPEFFEIVKGVYHLRERFRPEVKLALLSNSNRVTEGEVISALEFIDAKMMKLDAGDEETFRAINRPAPGVNFIDILEGLKKIPNLTIQSMLVDGIVSNTRGNAYEAWAKLLAEVKPKKVHVYSIDRPTAYYGVKVTSPRRLEIIAEDLRQRFCLEVVTFSDHHL